MPYEISLEQPLPHFPIVVPTGFAMNWTASPFQPNRRMFIAQDSGTSASHGLQSFTSESSGLNDTDSQV